MELNLAYLTASRLFIPQADPISLYLVGCGGTGSWLAPTVVRVARLLNEKLSGGVQVFFIDPDRVEAKNVYRQNFCDAEIGAYKAETLAFRYSLTWGFPISAFCMPFEESHLRPVSRQALVILIGCVDNAHARCSLHDTLQNINRNLSPRCWWLDCGNEHAHGQVLLGCTKSVSANAFSLPGYCSALPIPSIQHPELLVPESSGHLPIEMEGLSCAEMALLDSQGFAINQRIAGEAGDFLIRMLITKDLKRFACYLDLESGVTRSRYITPENILLESS